MKKIYKIIFTSIYTVVVGLVIFAVVFGFMMGGGFSENIGLGIVVVPILISVLTIGIIASWKLVLAPHNSISRFWKIFFYAPIFLVGIIVLINLNELIEIEVFGDLYNHYFQ